MDFAADSGAVMSGGGYALVLSTTGQALVGWLGGGENPYPRGGAYVQIGNGVWEAFTDIDMVFRIYVCMGPTSTVASHWGAVKSLFR